MSDLIVVTGLRGSGKTTLSHLLADELSYQVRNVGDLLAEHLRSANVPFERREMIGPLFIRTFGIDGYVSVVRRAAGPGTILDGLRLPPALHALESRGPLLHIHRAPDPTSTTMTPYEYYREAGALRSAAHCAVEWCPDLRDLPGEIKRRVTPTLAALARRRQTA
jgi:hypothetical protein